MAKNMKFSLDSQNISYLSKRIIHPKCDLKIKSAVSGFLQELRPAHTTKAPKHPTIWKLLADHLDEPFIVLSKEWRNIELNYKFSFYAQPYIKSFNRKLERGLPERDGSRATRFSSGVELPYGHWKKYNRKRREIKPIEVYNDQWLVSFLSGRYFNRGLDSQVTQNQDRPEFFGTLDTLKSLIVFCQSRVTKPKGFSVSQIREYCLLCHNLTQAISFLSGDNLFEIDNTILHWRNSYSLHEIEREQKNKNYAIINRGNLKYCEIHIPSNKRVPNKPSFGVDIKGVYLGKYNLFEGLCEETVSLFMDNKWPVPSEKVRRLIAYLILHPTNGKKILREEISNLHNAKVKRAIFFEKILAGNLNEWGRYFSITSEYEVFNLRIGEKLIEIQVMKHRCKDIKITDIQSEYIIVPLDIKFSFLTLQKKINKLLNIVGDVSEVFLPLLDIIIFLKPTGTNPQIEMRLGSKYYLNEMKDEITHSLLAYKEERKENYRKTKALNLEQI